MARRGVVLRLIGVAAVVGVLCAVCLGTAAATTITAVALGLFATLCGAGVVICSRRATR